MKNLVLLKTGKIKNKNVFLIHAGNGEIQNYVLFSSYISPDISCWAIRADRFTNHTPVNRTIFMMAAKYIKIIKEVQPRGPYYIAGWCFGGIRAFEIARQLETIGEEVRFLAQFNSHVPILDDGKRLTMVENYSLLSLDMSKPKTMPRFTETSEKILINTYRYLLIVNN